MYQRLFPLALLLCSSLPAAPVMAQVMAQVTVNPGALDQLGGGPTPAPQPSPAAPHAAPRHPVHKPDTRPADAKPGVQKSSPAPAHAPAHPTGTTAPPRPPKPPSVPQAPPPEAVLKPLEPAPPPHPSTPPPPPPVIADAPGEAADIPQGVRVTFGPDRSDLNPATEAALAAFAHRSPEATYNLTAFASGTPSDPSTPRRLSLSRALAVRAILIAQGIPSTRIYAHALGPNTTEGPTDRVDVVAAIPPAPKPDAAPASPQPGTPAPANK